MPTADLRFWATTRGQLLVLLRRGSETVAELAAAPGLTAHTVRAHLTALERDGLVRQTGTGRGPGPPEMCRVVETLLAGVLAVPVRHQCRSDPPRCRFEIGEPS
jgi:DNA-binding transcriptional ArsR family regulator